MVSASFGRANDPKYVLALLFVSSRADEHLP